VSDICAHCGNLAVLRCRACHAEVPPVTGGVITDGEIESVFAQARSRMHQGRDTYGGSFTRADLKADAIEECLDLINYAALMIVRLNRSLPTFAGPTSAELVENG
jgi:hypothetical protein